MPRRKIVLTNGEYYHIYNRSSFGLPIFGKRRETKLFLEAAAFYLQVKPATKFSVYRKSRNEFPFTFNNRLVSIVNYCLMPNHFHFTLRQESEKGISRFIQRLTNSFSHYYGIKNQIQGHIFQDKFKAVHIEKDEQLLHLSRYIHLNPVTANLVKKPEDYEFSSYNIYLGRENSEVVLPKIVLDNFKGRGSYEKFVLSRKEYQRSLAKIKHLISE